MFELARLDRTALVAEWVRVTRRAGRYGIRLCDLAAALSREQLVARILDAYDGGST